MRILTHADVDACLPMAECIEAMQGALAELARGGFHQPLRVHAMAEGGRNRLVTMPALRLAGRPLWGLKEIVVTPANPVERGLDAHQGAVLLHDGDSGVLLGIVNAAALTAIRTAAVSAVATRALAAPGARRVAIVGSGVQAGTHIEAMRCVLPEAMITVASRDAGNARRLAERHGVAAAESVEAAVREADVICTTTNATQPVLVLEWLRPGCHLNAVGTSIASARELDARTVAACTLFVDRRESGLAEAGEIVQAIAEGAITAAHIRAELGEVLAGLRAGRTATAERTLFKSLGLAVEDLVAAEVACRNAESKGIGTLIDAW